MKEDDVRRIVQEMVRDEVLNLAKEIRELLLLNLEVSVVLLSGVSNIENFSGSRRCVVDLIQRYKTTMETMKQRAELEKDDRRE